MTNSKVKPPVWYWIVSVIALIWNGLGVDGYLGQAYNTERYRSAFTPEQLKTAANAPSWIMGAFAIAVFSAVIASIGLLFRKKWAYSLYLLSLIAVIAQMGYLLINGHHDNIGMTISIIVFALLLVWFSKKSISKSWIS